MPIPRVTVYPSGNTSPGANYSVTATRSGAGGGGGAASHLRSSGGVGHLSPHIPRFAFHAGLYTESRRRRYAVRCGRRAQRRCKHITSNASQPRLLRSRSLWGDPILMPGYTLARGFTLQRSCEANTRRGGWECDTEQGRGGCGWGNKRNAAPGWELHFLRRHIGFIILR